jgi:hypothetical protein
MPNRYSDPHESLDPPDSPPEPLDFEPTRDLPGAVFMIPNRHWGFEAVSTVDHPGACLHYSQTDHEGLLLQGTDANNVPRSRVFYVVQPTAENGLQIPTAFRLAPRYFRGHRLRLYFPQRYLGRLDEDTLLALRDELARLNPEE